MKRLAILFSMFSLLVGCEKHEELDLIDNNNNYIENEGVLIGDLPAKIYANVESEEDTRAFVGDDNKSVLWHNGDDISYFGRKLNSRYVYNGEDAAAGAVFNLDVRAQGSNISITDYYPYTFALYPYDDMMTIDFQGNIALFNVTYPSMQEYAEGSFGKGANVMVARKPYEPTNLTTARGYKFRHTGGYLVVKLYGNGVTVKSVSISALDSSVKLAGKGLLVYYPDENIEVYMNDDSSATSEVILNLSSPVTLGATKEEATEFWFALPIVNIEGGFKVKAVTTDNRVFEKQTTKTINIGRGKVQPMAALDIDPNIAPADQLFYTTSDGEKVDFSHLTGKWWPFNVDIVSHTYENGIGIITCEGPLKYINEEAFYRAGLSSITLPEQLVHIGKNAFARNNFKSITFPGSLKEIMKDAFYKCLSLNTVTFKPSPTGQTLRIGRAEAEWGADITPFYNSPLVTVNLNRNIEQMDEDGELFVPNSGSEGLFYSGQSLSYDEDGNKITTVNIGDQVHTLSAYMFEEALISEITIPANVTSIESDVFHACENLTKVVFQSGSADLRIGPTTESTYEYGPFNDSKNLTTLYLDRNLVPTYNINGDEEGLFSQLPALTNVTLGSNVKTISNRMFLDAPITSIDIPNSVTTIDTYAFYDCTSLKSVKIGSGAKTLGEDIFDGCTSLNTLDLGLPTISDYMFTDLPITSLTIRDGVKSIGEEAFYGTQITSLDIPGSVTHIGEEAFLEVPISTLTIGHGVKSIGEEAFYGTPITSLTIPGSVNHIGADAFYNCESLSFMEFKPSPTGEDLKLVVVWSNAGVFYRSPLKTIILNRQLRSVDSDGDEAVGNIFNSPSRNFGTSLTLGEQVKSIEPRMFERSRVMHVTIPESVTFIGYWAFRECKWLESFTMLPKTPPTVSYTTSDQALIFQYCYDLDYISVPAESLEAYRKAPGWNEYTPESYRPIEE